MTKAQLNKKVKELIRKGKPEFDRMIQKSINSQGIDITNADDNYILAKVILSAVYGEMAYQYEPFDKEGKRQVKNLRIFI